jgi:hypothetical protein
MAVHCAPAPGKLQHLPILHIKQPLYARARAGQDAVPLQQLA